jgi:transposase
MIPGEQIETMRQLRYEGKTFDQIADSVGRTKSVVGDIVCGRGGFEGLGIEEGQVRGVRSSKLSRDEVDEIRRLYGTGEFTQKEVAAVFGIHHSAVSYIVRGKRWKKVA